MIEQHKTIVIIPSHMGAKGLPGKALADLCGQPLIVHVWKSAVAANIGHVLVAAAENAIAEAVRAAGGDAMVTPPHLPSGTDRIAAALKLRDPAQRYEYVVSVEGDLPFIDALTLRRCLAGLTNEQVDIATVAAESVAPSDFVKVIAPLEGEREVAYARDFSREAGTSNWQNLPVYAFRRAALEKFAALPQSENERARRIELMRALDNEMKIAVVKVDSLAHAVNTPASLEAARGMIRKG